MDPITQQAVLATAGAAGGDKVYVDDVFSTFLVDGAGGQTITTGIDLATEGGMVWSRVRSAQINHAVHDTERGTNKFLSTNSNGAQIDVSGNTAHHSITSFNNDGFTTGADGGYGYTDLNGYTDYVHWTFRKAPGFFDVVTYTGNGTNQTIPHNLESVPGFIVVKAISGASAGSYMWTVYHRGLSSPETSYSYLNATTMFYSNYNGYWNGTAPTSTHFSVGNDTYVNRAGYNYVAYVFAHDEPVFGTNEDESIIKCGSYTGNGSATGPVINLGFEPQWLMIRRTDVGDAWQIYDSMRGQQDVLRADSSNTEVSSLNYKINLLANGFQPASNDNGHNASGGNYIYMAIRRPHKPPEVGTDVFDDVLYTGTYSGKLSTSLNYTDLVFLKSRSGYPTIIFDRMRGDKQALNSGDDQREYTYVDQAGISLDVNNGISFNLNWYGVVNGTNTNYVSYHFKRAPGFFDIVAYTGTGATQTCNHNLGVTPELVIIKNRNQKAPGSNDSSDWLCWHKDLTETNPYIFLNSSAAEGPFGGVWITPSSTGLNLGSAPSHTFYNDNGTWYISYLFATLPGISKVGSYNGSDNSTVNVPCGFTGAPRFLMIKRTDDVSSWHVWDSARGINSGTNSYDPLLKLDTSDTEAIYGDHIDPTTSGFTVKPAATAAGLNNTNGTYIFLAIA
tara:strand:+ start:1060 stop:3081 length:2022 start_codon:yes stop_codon:yes gene_type:complete